jgi:hypothetical protein
MAAEEDGLSEADRRGIADIRRELDAEFGALEEAVPLRTDDAPPPGARRTVRRPPSIRPLIVAAFGVGVLAGTLAGGAGVFLWLRRAHDDVARSTRSVSLPPAEERPPAPADVNLASLHAALDEWIEATQRGDIESQMRFYPSRVPVYYTWRDVPRDAVRAEKVTVFGEATRLLIATDTPTIDLADDGATAVTHFRKRYVIEGPAVRRRGEVLQEMRWERTDDGWVIVSERDARVLASD